MLLLALTVAGCNLSGAPPTPTFAVGMETPAAQAPEITAIAATPPATSTGATPAAGPVECLWNWNTQPLPDLSGDVQAALDAAGIANAVTSATAFGEDCLDSVTRETRYFATTQTDFAVTLEVKDLADVDALGQLAGEVLAVLDDFPPEQTPGPNPGRITLLFVADEYVREARFTVTEANAALAQGLSEAALLEALNYRP